MKTEEKLAIEWWPVSRLIPYQTNPRRITDLAVSKVADSIQRFGWRQPIVVDLKDVIIIGHTRRLAAIKLNLELVPVHVADLPPDQARALRIADNRTGEEATWDVGLLGTELAELSACGLDLAATGFDCAELESLMTPTAEEDAELNRPVEPPVTPVTRLGDVWFCGEHRVLCGDATSQEDVRLLLGSLRPTLMVTDPPYGVEYDAAWRHRAGLNKSKSIGAVPNDDRADWAAAWRLFPGDVCYIWHGGLHAGTVAASLLEYEFEVRSQIIWAKPSLVIGRGHYHWQHEPAWYAVRKGKTARWVGDRKQSTLWQVPHVNHSAADDGHTIHSTQKPIELMRRPMLNHTKRGEGLYDPFLGSGSTLVAAEQVERVCFGIDIDPRYVDVAVERWQRQTGKQATLGGVAFDQVAENRKEPKHARTTAQAHGR